MCGIAGALVFDGSDFRITESYLVAMRDAMIHRGPDGEGVWRDPSGRIGLAHRRLSIIDLSEAAAQPMLNEDATVSVVFNGEIYNHAELRTELRASGATQWKTHHSDTEVLLRAYERWGIECVHRFRGMFAFALWDAHSNDLWLVRDRIGIKPLYYSAHHGRLTFASEIKALLQDPQQPREVNEEGLFHYLSFLTTPAPSTLFGGINKLSGGTWMRVRPDGSVREERYWDVWDHTNARTGVSEQEICEEVLGRLRSSVRYRKVADVPVGVFLSGGVDSSTNASLFAEDEVEPVRTFTIGYEGDFASYRNELDHARAVADATGSEHHELLLSLDDLLGFLPDMVSLQDEPIADPVCFPVHFLSRLARDSGVVVCQVGEGADELFCGYPSWHDAIRRQRALGPLPRAAARLAASVLPVAGKGGGRGESLRRAGLGQPVFWSGAEAFTDAQKRSLLAPRLRKAFSELTSWEALAPTYKRFTEKAWEPSVLNWMTYTDLCLRLPELLLMRIDKMSMGVGLECRVPFLDHDLVALALSIPSSLKTDGGVPKRLLKRAVRGVLPDQVVDRPKQGFGVPLHEYFFDRLGDLARHELSAFVEETDFLDPVAVDRLLGSGQGTQVWYLLNLALWWKTYLK